MQVGRITFGGRMSRLTKDQLDELLENSTAKLKDDSRHKRQTAPDRDESRQKKPDKEHSGHNRVTNGSKCADGNKPDKYDGDEKAMQRECNEWLRRQGFDDRMNEKRIQTHHTGLWYVHLHETRNNPRILDYLLLDSNRMKYAEVELKVSEGRLSPHQNAIILRGEGAVCWNVEQFKNVVRMFLASD